MLVDVDDEPGLPQPGDVVAGKYRVQAAIGAGGMGAVFRATHALTGKEVALKPSVIPSSDRWRGVRMTPPIATGVPMGVVTRRETVSRAISTR